MDTAPRIYAAGCDAMPGAIVKLLLAAGAESRCPGRRRNGRYAGPPNAAIAKWHERWVFQRRSADISEYRLCPMAPVSNTHPVSGPSGLHSAREVELQFHTHRAAIARDHGLPAPKVDLAPINVPGMGWGLFDFASNRMRRDYCTDAVVRYTNPCRLRKAIGGRRKAIGRP